MSPAVAARGKIRRAERRGETIPLGYALDKDGRQTTDPKAALGGVVLPIGGHKGSGMSMMMDIFGGVISGAAFGGDVRNQYKVYDRPQDVGHFFLAMSPICSSRRTTIARAWTRWSSACAPSPTAEGFDEIMIPGETRSAGSKRRIAAPASRTTPKEIAPAGGSRQGRSASGCRSRPRRWLRKSK